MRSRGAHRRASKPAGNWRLDRAAQGWARRLVVLFTMTCLVIVASAAPPCEMVCALDQAHAAVQAHGGTQAHHGPHHHGKAVTPHDAAGELHAGACHLSAAAVMPALACDPGPVDAPTVRASRHAPVIASLSWPPPERPPRPASFS
jgi:hypothetical protein